MLLRTHANDDTQLSRLITCHRHGVNAVSTRKPKAIQINCGTDVLEAGWNHGIFNR